MEPTIWTIGHSNQSLESFIHLLKHNNIELVADVRRFPGSSKYPHFNKENLLQTLPVEGINYLHFESLGGRRKPFVNSINTVWRNEAFRGFADYMETSEFKTAFANLREISKDNRTAIMCSEILWWRCHRSVLADLLKSLGYNVLHIMPQKIQEHPYTSAAKIIDGKLSYSAELADLFNSNMK